MINGQVVCQEVRENDIQTMLNGRVGDLCPSVTATKNVFNFCNLFEEVIQGLPGEDLAVNDSKEPLRESQEVLQKFLTSLFYHNV